TGGNEAGSDQVTIPSGSTSATIDVTTNGDTVVEADEPITVTLDATDNGTISLTDNVGTSSFTNDDTATLTITNESVAEDVVGGNMVFTVTLDNAVAGGTQVAYSFTNGTAGGTDYANTPNTLNFVGNASETQDITVAITDDTIIELDETFTVNLGPPTNGVTVSGSPATGTIINDDTAVASITASDDTAEEQGLDPGAFTVNIGGVNNTGSPITVDYNVGGTATPGSDYATLSGSVSIINGQQNGIIPVTPLNDSEVETDETIVVTLVAGAGYTVGAPNSDTVTLVSEDNTPPDGYTLTINQDPINITNETAVSFTMTNIPAFSTSYEFSFSSSGDGNVSTVTGSGSILALIGGTRSNLDISSLPDGVITLSVVVSNILGTEGPPTTDTAVKYTAVPSGYTATIDQSIINFDNQTSINFTFAGAEVGADYTYTFTSDGGGTPVNGSGTITTLTDNIANIDLSSLADGLVTLSVTLENINGTGAVVQDTSDKDTSVCNAGGGAPVLDATEPTVFCGDFLVNLNDYVTNVAPVGSTLTWSTNPDPNQTDGHRNSMVSSAAQYFGFFYDDVNACASPILTVTLTNFPIPVIIDPTGDERCGEGTLTLTASSDSGVLSWYDVPTGGTALDTGGVFITPSISETTSFYVEATANGCTTERIEVIATVLDAPSPGTATDVVACNSESEDGPNTVDLDDTLSGADAGTWAVITDPSNGSVAIGAGNVVNFTDLAIGDYVFEYTTTVTAGPCENSSVQVTVTVEDCFANADIDLVLTKEVDNASPLLDDVITFTITLENTTMDRILDIVVTDVLDEAFEYIGDDATVGTYDPNTGEWTIADLASDVATATLEITVRVTELGTFQNTAVLTSSLPVDEVINNNTATISVTVGRDQCTDPGTLCTIFSPNNDGINDRLKFVDPNDDYTNNRLEIFDRYGNSVFAMDGYDSSWDGTGKNGAVPKGTYFYILDLHGDGAEVIKGWIQIIR
ncbi:gliding motility-associated C-terminal domain-containing protein, partial [Flagellimonas olearia]|uniref:T9SS type B sorting domain-containing protein n=1 Tax=Flagellimonas olearia TaxID=552546 RepID=UPI00147862A6